MVNVLDNPVWVALTGPQGRLGQRRGGGARFQPEVSLFGGVAEPGDPRGWDDFRELVAPGEKVIVAVAGLKVPDGWEADGVTPGYQLIGEQFHGAADPEAVALGAADVPEMLDLTARTRPGPFGVRTVELGGYVGIRRGGALVAMAGERMLAGDHAEISAVCTDPAFRGQGLARRLVGAVAHGIRGRGQVPMLHVARSNTGALRLYEALGFVVRTQIDFAGVSPRPA